MSVFFAHRSFPGTRLRRLRQKTFFRSLVQESRLAVHDLILPVFVCAGHDLMQPIDRMPDVYRYSPDRLIVHLEEVVRLGIPAIEIFPQIDSSLKDLSGTQALRDDNVVCQSIRLIKKHFPELGVMADIALDPYTVTGQDGVVDDSGRILNDQTTALLVEQALVCARAGADLLSPSDMMDGRVAAIRQKLDEQGFSDCPMVVHAAKYASALYTPFRDAVGSAQNLGKSNKETYQLNPANGREALAEVSLDLVEGADVVLIKPGLPYLDILYQVKSRFGVPTFVYHVSGEYAMIKAAARAGYIDEMSVLLECLLSFKRAGADAILTYAAVDAARWLADHGG